jgi:uncharacterized protein (DUF2249 family)
MNIDKIRARLAGFVFEQTEMPAIIRDADACCITDLDVREDLRNGIEPFSRIMAAQAGIPLGGVLRLRATFEPVPLYTALGHQGFSHWTERLADDDWRVWFYRGDIAAAPSATPAVSDAGELETAGVVLLDVRGLLPPEPMQLTLEMLAQLGPNESLVQINSRVPQLLLPHLQERGYEYVLISEAPNEVRGMIRPIHKTEKA